MKKLILVLFFVLGLAVQANADDFLYTGKTAFEDSPNAWFFGGSGENIGGANNQIGVAQQFEVGQETSLTNLDVSIKNLVTNVGTTTFTYNLYTASNNEAGNSLPVPDNNSLAFTSEPISITTIEQEVIDGQPIQSNEQIAFNNDLQPGTYWLAEQGNGPDELAVSQTYEKSNAAVAPEPGTIWLMLFGMAPFLFLKRKQIFPFGQV